MAAASAREGGSTVAGSKGLLDYLRTTITHETLLDLYADNNRGHFVCRAILQQLDEVEKQIVMRLTCCGGSFPLEGKARVQDWIVQKDKLRRRLKELRKWGIVESDKGEVLTLTPQFHKGITASMRTLDSSPWVALSPSAITRIAREAGVRYTPVTLAHLETETQTKWDSGE